MSFYLYNILTTNGYLNDPNCETHLWFSNHGLKNNTGLYKLC